MNIKSPCLLCNRRHVLCHSNCEEYLKYKQQVEDRNEMERAAKKTMNDCFPSICRKRQSMR